MIVEGIRANGKDGKDLTPEGRQQQLQEFNEKLRRKEEMIENLEEELEQTKMEAQAKHSNPWSVLLLPFPMEITWCEYRNWKLTFVYNTTLVYRIVRIAPQGYRIIIYFLIIIFCGNEISLQISPSVQES